MNKRTVLIGHRVHNKFKIISIIKNDGNIGDVTFDCMIQSQVSMLRIVYKRETIEAVDVSNPILEYVTLTFKNGEFKTEPQI